MRMIDRQYTQTPFYGAKKLQESLERQGYHVGEKRVRRLMKKLGLQPVYPKPKTSKKNPEHAVYPYLLRGVTIERPNHVWSADITYIPTLHGFVYLVAVIDWFSRYVLSWCVSTTLEVGFCLESLDDSLRFGKPEIFNTDQGSQFTSLAFTGCLKANGIQISMDGRGRVFDNIFVERLWRTVKYEEVYLKEYRTVAESVEGLDSYFRFYNEKRFHQSLEYLTPHEVYLCGGQKSLSGVEFSS